MRAQAGKAARIKSSVELRMADCYLRGCPLAAACCCIGATPLPGWACAPPHEQCYLLLPGPAHPLAGVVYRVLGTPLTPGAAVMDVTGPGQLVGGQVRPQHHCPSGAACHVMRRTFQLQACMP